MKTKYNYNLEIKQFFIKYFKLLGMVIFLPLLVIFAPLLTLWDFCLKPFGGGFQGGYWKQLYLRYITLSNFTVDL